MNHSNDPSDVVDVREFPALNVVRENQRIKLIDLDACASLKDGYSGAKFSSAFLPPEMIHCHLHVSNDDGGDGTSAQTYLKHYKVKTFQVDLQTGLPITTDLPYDLVPAAIAHDVWSLGVILFQMCTGEPLFLANDEDNIDEGNLEILFEFSEEFKAKKMKKIKDTKARNLIGQLLNKDPKKRPGMNLIAIHPFITGKSAARMVGEEAEFDVFISYRVASDAAHVERLYNILTKLGVKVWWDKKCLLPGEPWEEGFCQGLIKSRAFVPLLSRGAIKNPTVPWQNFENLTEGSRCDNVFLEHRLALELREMGFIEKIYPVSKSWYMGRDWLEKVIDLRCSPHRIRAVGVRLAIG